jgi:hypothetical protein
MGDAAAVAAAALVVLLLLEWAFVVLAWKGCWFCPE